MEKHIEARYREAVKFKGGLCLKLTCPGFTGIPDRLCLLPDARIWFAEFKFKKGVLSSRQSAVRILLQRLGFIVKVINELNVDEEIKLI